VTSPAEIPTPSEPAPPRDAFPGGYPVGYQVPQQAYGPVYPRPAFPPPAGYLPPPFPISPGGYRLADFGDRLLAYLIDSLIVGLISAVLVVPVIVIALLTLFRDTLSQPTAFGPAYDNPDALPPGQFLLVVFVMYAITLLFVMVVRYVYDVELAFRSGQTVGKRIMKIKVIPVDPSLGLTRGLAFKRFLVQYVAAVVVPFLNYLDGFWQLWDQPYRQCLHDKYASTLVIKLNA
jgi:uncharacterized RDD family membrane protein YckC